MATNMAQWLPSSLPGRLQRPGANTIIIDFDIASTAVAARIWMTDESAEVALLTG